MQETCDVCKKMEDIYIYGTVYFLSPQKIPNHTNKTKSQREKRNRKTAVVKKQRAAPLKALSQSE